MGVEAAIVTVVAAIGAIGAYLGGKRNGKSGSLSDDVNAVTILQAAVAELEKQLKAKDNVVAELFGRVQVLEGLVTQKADVAAVENQVREVRKVVDRIAEKIDA